jgi:uncharacterized protein (DUF433 family)
LPTAVFCWRADSRFGRPTITEHIVMTPGTCGGKPRIAGTRIRVAHVYHWHEVQGRSPAQIVADYPHLKLADVHAALAYFWDHREEVLAEIRADEEYVRELKAKAPPSLFQQRLAERHL